MSLDIEIVGSDKLDVPYPDFSLSVDPFLRCGSFQIANLDGKIVGGHDVEIEDYPYQISMQYYSMGHICGGSVIRPDVILTAAHCIIKAFVEYLSILHSTNDIINKDGVSISVSALKVHDQYSHGLYDNDVAVMYLLSPIEFNSNKVGIIQLTEVAGGNIMRTATLSGWGATEFGESQSDVLQAITVNEVPFDDCNASHDNRLTDSMMCFTAIGKDACQLDSGGPLVDLETQQQIGIFSWGRDCTHPLYPGVYTDVYKAREWIDSVTDMKNNAILK
ncbi:hypothetical protein FQA39_LY04054 [Lamprigera yunnana]|nr:hypothetical protein FQA39_LY04054 [Lamprigera yunnana]